MSNIKTWDSIKIASYFIVMSNLLLPSSMVFATEFFVSPSGSDKSPGTAAKPFQTIQKAADIMQAGDTCTVLEGVYREWVVPARGGTSESKRITYRAAKGNRVVIKGSERIQSWTTESDGVWKAVIPDSFFGDYNPFKRKLEGEFITYGKEYHMGDVYLNGKSFKEMLKAEEVYKNPRSFFAEDAADQIVLYANFERSNPNDELVEINVRECVFFPAAKGLSYITVEGFTMQHAAANWACFRAFQHALIGTYYGKNWIIQNNTITDARCVGIVCGNDPSHQDEGFDLEVTGHHIIRNNIIRRCGEAGIHGFKGWVASVIENNLIEDINAKDEFGGWETGGIKIHDGVDVVIRNNIFRRVHTSKKRGEFAAIWIDWGGQGVRITGNIVYNCTAWAIYLQNNHGPILVDNNIFAGPVVQASDNCVFAHNLFADCHMRYDVTNSQFEVVYYKPHTATPVGVEPKHYVNDRYLNNIFTVRGADQIPAHTRYQCDFNLFYEGAKKSTWADARSIQNTTLNANVRFQTLVNGVIVSWATGSDLNTIKCPLINYDLIGKLGLPDQGIESADGAPINVDRDILGQKRSLKSIIPGPLKGQKKNSTVTRIVKGAMPE